MPAGCFEHTILPQLHLHLQALELVGRVRLHLSTHAFATPLLQAVELLVDYHGAVW